MKNNSLLLAILTIALSSSISLHAQSLSIRHVAANSSARALMNGDGSAHYSKPGKEYSGEPMQVLSNGVSIVGADSLPIWGHFQQQQSDGRALHNIQVDPSNPLNVHAVVMEETSTNPSDTFFSYRRLLYSFSSDGGHTWKTPDTLGTARTGFASMVLYKHNGNYVPIIAGHMYQSNSNSSLIESAIWVEQGNPGDGNFAMTPCPTTDSNGTADLLWPYVGVSPSGNTIYIVSCYDDPNSTSAVGFLQFGTFTIDESGKATFNHWSSIGAYDTIDNYAGYDQEGDVVLRVSPQGKIGLLWRETDYFNGPNTSLNFIESTDGGNTWPSSFNPLEAIVDQEFQDPSGNDVYSGPWTGLDFFYSGENAKIVWSADNESFDPTGNTYYPIEVSLHCYDVATGVNKEFVSNRDSGADISPDSSQYSLLGMLPSFNNTIDSESDPYIAYPTIAQSFDPNTFAVFYQTFPLADTVVVSASGGVKLYGSIYYQLTQDGGFTWTAPTPFRTNDGPAGSFGKIDFRWPSVSDWNGASLGAFSPTAMYGADTAAGTTAKNGDPDWDVVTFFRDSIALGASLSVSNNPTATGVTLESYPNPFTALATINFTLTSDSKVLLTVTDMLGRSVATLVNGSLGAGAHSAVFNAQNLADGVYRYTLQANGVSTTGSMSLIR